MSDKFVLLTEKESMWAEMLMQFLKENGIPCIASPVFGAGFVVKNSLHDRLRVSVPAERLTDAQDILKAYFPEDN